MRRVLIAGFGYVGRALARELADDEVFALSRGGEPAPGVVPIRADLTDPRTLTTLPAGLDLVYYTAAADGSTDAAYEAAYVRGPSVLLAALAEQRQSPRRVFFTSSTGVYGPGSGEWVDETTPPAPRDFSGARVLEGERVLADGPFPATVVRFGGIYGPGRERLVAAVRAGAPLHDGAPEYTNRIHRDDCAGVLAHLGRLPAPAALYLGVDCDPAERNAVVAFVAAELGLGAPRRLPAPPQPSGPGRGGNRRCSNRRLLETGYRFRYPSYVDGYRALIQEAARARE